jgi:hypothetical protein
MKSVRWNKKQAAQGDGLDIESLDLPLGGRLFLRSVSSWAVMKQCNKIGCYKLMAFRESESIRSGPVVTCVIAPSGYQGTVDAGRLIQRLWTGLNAVGLAVQPFYVATDQEIRLRAGLVPAGCRAVVADAVSALARMLGLQATEQLQMILRIGWPTKAAKRSHRLPIGHIFRDTSQRGFR